MWVGSERLLNRLNHTCLLVLVFTKSMIIYLEMSVTFDEYQLYAIQLLGGVIVALNVEIGMVLMQYSMPESPAIIMAHCYNSLGLRL